MGIRKVNDFVYLIDLKPMGIEDTIASYVLQGDKIVIIETGPTVSIGNLLGGLEKIGIKTEEVDYVAVSHVHIDHVGGAGTLLHHLPNAKLLVHGRGAPHLINPEKLWTHTHLSFYESKGNGIFAGDAAGIYLNKFDVIVPTTPAPFNLEMTLASIARLTEMKPRNLYYTHFGHVDNAIGRLKDYRDRLELWAEIIVDEMRTEDDPKKIYKKILLKDPQINMVSDFLENHMIFRRGVLMQNIQGFIGYFRRTSKTASSDKAT